MNPDFGKTERLQMQDDLSQWEKTPLLQAVGKTISSFFCKMMCIFFLDMLCFNVVNC